MSGLETPSFKVEDTVEITREEAPFAPENQLGTYKLKRWTWYEKQAAVTNASEIIDAERGLVRLRVEDYFAGMLYATVREYPEGIEWTIDFIKGGLDVDVGDVLRDVGKDLNGLSDKERKLFLQQSDAEKDIPI